MVILEFCEKNTTLELHTLWDGEARSRPFGCADHRIGLTFVLLWRGKRGKFEEPAPMPPIGGVLAGTTIQINNAETT
jgi:hypothetical protein